MRNDAFHGVRNVEGRVPPRPITVGTRYEDAVGVEPDPPQSESKIRSGWNPTIHAVRIEILGGEDQKKT
ncbi:MAG: hypothetical protein N3D11_15780 [Candidatus Sumerlaeia bacterium]|nr:hypothetical protein [Candidatus Sumerlaeia bacterium]